MHDGVSAGIKSLKQLRIRTVSSVSLRTGNQVIGHMSVFMKQYAVWGLNDVSPRNRSDVQMDTIISWCVECTLLISAHACRSELTGEIVPHGSDMFRCVLKNGEDSVGMVGSISPSQEIKGC